MKSSLVKNEQVAEVIARAEDSFDELYVAVHQLQVAIYSRVL